MENSMELNLKDMEQVTGGAERTVNTGVDNLNAAVRSGPSKSSAQIASLVNGTKIDTVTGNLVFDEVSGRNFVEIYFIGKDGSRHTGWIASSIVGLKR